MGEITLKTNALTTCKISHFSKIHYFSLYFCFYFTCFTHIKIVPLVLFDAFLLCFAVRFDTALCGAKSVLTSSVQPNLIVNKTLLLRHCIPTGVFSNFLRFGGSLRHDQRPHYQTNDVFEQHHASLKHVGLKNIKDNTLKYCSFVKVKAYK